jgi:hypothetical protein
LPTQKKNLRRAQRGGFWKQEKQLLTSPEQSYKATPGIYLLVVWFWTLYNPL